MSGVKPKDLNIKSKRTVRISFSLNNLFGNRFGIVLIKSVMNEHLIDNGFDDFFTGMKFKVIMTLLEIHPDEHVRDLDNIAATWRKVMIDRLKPSNNKFIKCGCITDDNIKFVVGNAEFINYELPPSTMRFTVINILDNDKSHTRIFSEYLSTVDARYTKEPSPKVKRPSKVAKRASGLA